MNLFTKTPEGLLNECFTGSHLTLSSHLLLDNEEELRNQISHMKRLQLRDCCNFYKRPNAFTSEGLLARLEDSTPQKAQSASPGAIVMWVIPYRKPASLQKDRHNNAFAAWHITDLRESFGVLLVYDDAYQAIKSAFLGELWGLINPSLLPVSLPGTSNSTMNRKHIAECPVRRTLSVRTRDQIFRVGRVARFSFCTASTFSGSVCNQPFEAEAEQGQQPRLCPDHVRRQQPLMSDASRRNLDADGVVVVASPTGATTRSIDVLRHHEDGCVDIERRSDGKIRLRTTQSNQPTEGGHPCVSQEEIAQRLRQRMQRYEKEVLKPRSWIRDPLEPAVSESTSTVHVPEEEATLNAMSTVAILYNSYVQTPTAELRLQLEKQLRLLKLPKNLTPALTSHATSLLKSLMRAPKDHSLHSVLFVTKRRLQKVLGLTQHCCIARGRDEASCNGTAAPAKRQRDDNGLTEHETPNKKCITERKMSGVPHDDQTDQSNG